MSEKLTMKTPVTYYGGKQTMVNIILPFIPLHNLYCEPFCGGAAIFWAKAPSKMEVLNDTNRNVVNFYKVLKTNFKLLKKEIDATLHSRDLYSKAFVIYSNPDLFDDVKRAWAFWVLSLQSFNASLDTSWSYDKAKQTIARKVNNFKQNFVEDLAKRLEIASIECADACYIIRGRDTEQSFFYCDPPYYNANMGHYDGYSLADFKELLDTLASIKGKFLLSSYPSDILKEYTTKNGWFSKSYDLNKSACARTSKKQRRIEVLTANYEL